MYQYRLALESRRSYRQMPMVSGIVESDDIWAAPQPPRKKCEMCPTLLRKGNSGNLCWQCNRRIEAFEEANGKTYKR